MTFLACKKCTPSLVHFEKVILQFKSCYLTTKHYRCRIDVRAYVPEHLSQQIVQWPLILFIG